MDEINTLNNFQIYEKTENTQYIIEYRMEMYRRWERNRFARKTSVSAGIR